MYSHLVRSAVDDRYVTIANMNGNQAPVRYTHGLYFLTEIKPIHRECYVR